MKSLSERILLFLFAFTLCLNALLLFWVQPLIAKMILPLMGGSPSVWNTCMMFFQGMLLAGYAYAHLSVRYFARHVQILLQCGLLLSGLLFLPFVVDSSTILNNVSPLTGLVVLLFTLLAVPLLALCASSPLLQSWFVVTNHRHAKDPYFLYVASNLGSLIGLLVFPFLLEPWIKVSTQTLWWSVGFFGIVMLTLMCGISNSAEAVEVTPSTQPQPAVSITWGNRLHWLILAMLPSSLMLGLTTYITTDIASAPLFWIVPLLLYLLTMMIVFARRPVISLDTSRTMVLVLMVPVAFLFLRKLNFAPFWVVLLLHLSLFFFTALLCHGELVARRPHYQHLTRYYLWLSLGGFLGGVFNAVIAPMIFTNVMEFPIVYALALIVCPPALINRKYSAILVGTFMLFFVYHTLDEQKKDVYIERNFYGTVRIKSQKASTVLVHGTTIHGAQFKDPAKQKAISSYYAPIPDILTLLKRKKSHLKLATAGLGAGVLACAARPQDEMTFYEIDPSIVKIASNPKFFTYLKLCPPTGGIKMGDARLELAKAKDTYYDAIILDTFSSDAIPMHMLTEEAIAIYLKKLQPGGILAVHISNRHLNLAPVLGAIAGALHINAYYHYFLADREKGQYASRWVLLMKPERLMDEYWSMLGWKKLPSSKQNLWTDEYSNILRVLVW